MGTAKRRKARDVRHEEQENGGVALPDDTEAEVAALTCALAKARGVWLGEQTLQRLFTDTRRYIDEYSRALHAIERRTVHRHFAPAPPRPGASRHPPDPSQVDPWSYDPSTIQDETRTTCECPTCSGTTTVPCRDCSGTARVRCGNCWGSGRVHGARNRMKNCPSCRGGGSRPCGTCNQGRVPCTVCAASGSVVVWLSIAQQHMEQVLAHPMGPAAQVHKNINSPRDFDANPANWANVLTFDSGARPPADGLAAELRASLHAFTDRVLSTRVQSFSSIVHTFTYDLLLFGSGVIEVAGNPPAVSCSSNLRPLRIRQVASAATGAVVGIAALMIAASYTGRHAWYAAYGHGTLIAAIGVVLAGAVAALVAGLLLPRRAWSLLGLRAPLGLAAVAAVALGIGWFYPRPSTAAAQKALAENDVERATVEADALQGLGMDPLGGGAVLDDIRLRRLTGRGIDELLAGTREAWNLDDRRQTALSMLRDAALKESAALYAAKDAEGLTKLFAKVRDVDPIITADVGAKALLAGAERCIPQNDCGCVVRAFKPLAGAEPYASEVKRLRDAAVLGFAAAIKGFVAKATEIIDPRQRQRALRQGLDLAKCFPEVAGAPSDPPPATIEVLLVPVDHDVELADKKAAALAAIEEAKRQRQAAIDEAKRKQEAAIAEAKQRQADALRAAQDAAEAQRAHAASRSLVCRDGSTSGCLCAGSHRGCCSHHGAVAGCEP